jgi:hypothetical protein
MRKWIVVTLGLLLLCVSAFAEPVTLTCLVEVTEEEMIALKEILKERKQIDVVENGKTIKVWVVVPGSGTHIQRVLVERLRTGVQQITIDYLQKEATKMYREATQRKRN